MNILDLEGRIHSLETCRQVQLHLNESMMVSINIMNREIKRLNNIVDNLEDDMFCAFHEKDIPKKFELTGTGRFEF